MPVGIVARFEKQPDEIKPFSIPLHKEFLTRVDQPASVQVFLPGISISGITLDPVLKVVSFTALTGGMDGGDYDGVAYVTTTSGAIEEFDFVLYIRATPSQANDVVSGPSALDSANAAAASAVAAANSAAQAAASAQLAQTAQAGAEAALAGVGATATAAAQAAVAGVVSDATAARNDAQAAATAAAGSATAASGSATAAAGSAGAAAASATSADLANQAVQAAKLEVDADATAAGNAATAAAGSEANVLALRNETETFKNQAAASAAAAAASAAEAAGGGGGGGGDVLSTGVDVTDIVWVNGVATSWKEGEMVCSATYEEMPDGTMRQLTETLGTVTRVLTYNADGDVIRFAPAAP